MRYRITIALCLLGVLFFGLIIMYRSRSGMEGQTEGKLFLHSGGGLRLAVNECVEIFSEEFDAEVECNYAGSGVLLNQVQVTNQHREGEPRAGAVALGLADDLEKLGAVTRFGID